MRRQLLAAAGKSFKVGIRCEASCFSPVGRRLIQISAAPSNPSRSIEVDALPDGPATPSADSPDARFEVLGSPYSLLSVSLSASQNLYTRRGTLVGVSGNTENAVSTLSMLGPVRRAVLGIPFLYQRISSTTPLTALIATKSAITSFAVVHLDGTVDWMVAQRQGLLAWTGHSLSVRPTVNRRMSFAHWGNSHITGRGLIALVGKGQVYQIDLQAGESYVAHPSNVLAYTLSSNPPQPYRLQSTTLRFQIPSLSSLVPNTKFFNAMRDSDTWRSLTKILHTLRTWSRRTIWGDRLFLQFAGPTTILLQSRASRVADVLEARDVDEIASAPAGRVRDAVKAAAAPVDGGPGEKGRAGDAAPTQMRVATVRRDGEVRIEKADDFREFV